MSTKYWGEFTDSSEEEIVANKSPIPLSPVPFRPLTFYQPCLKDENERFWELNNQDSLDSEFSLLTLNPLDRPGTSKETTFHAYRIKEGANTNANFRPFIPDKVFSKETIHLMLKNSICSIFVQRGIDATTNLVLDVMVDVVVNFFNTLFANVKKTLDSFYSSIHCNLRHPIVPITVLLTCIEHALEQFPNITFQRLQRYVRNLRKSQVANAKKIPPNKPTSEQAHSSKRSKGKSSRFCNSNKRTKYTADTQPSNLNNPLENPWKLSLSEEEILNENDEAIQNSFQIERFGSYWLKTSNFPREKCRNLKQQKRKKGKVDGPKKKIKKNLQQKRKKIKPKSKCAKKRNVKKAKVKKESKLVKWSYSLPSDTQEKIYEAKAHTFLSDSTHSKQKTYCSSLELLKFELDMLKKDSFTEEDKERYKNLVEENDQRFAEFSENYIKNHRFMSPTYKPIQEEETPIIFQQYPPSEMEQKLKQEETFKNRILALVEADERDYGKIIKKYPLYSISKWKRYMHLKRQLVIERQRQQENIMKSTFYPRNEKNLESDIKSDALNLMIKKSKEKGKNIPPVATWAISPRYLIKIYNEAAAVGAAVAAAAAATAASSSKSSSPPNTHTRISTFINKRKIRRNPLLEAPRASPDYVPLRNPFTQPSFGFTSKGACYPIEKHSMLCFQPLEELNKTIMLKKMRGIKPSRLDYVPPVPMSDLTVSEKKKIFDERIKRIFNPKF